MLRLIVYESTSMTSATDDDALSRMSGWMQKAIAAHASDLHLIPGYPPVMRLHGDLTELDSGLVDDRVVERLIAEYSPATLAERFRADKDADFSFELEVNGKSNRFRVNVFLFENHPAACLRIIPPEIPNLDWAGFPESLATRLGKLHEGLVILAGMSGSGKTTTLAILVNQIHSGGGRRIITIEEPIEYRFARQSNSVVTQREVGTDVRSFADGLRSGLRQDPDVILVGEIRDRETAQMALSAAETGHLVLTSLHTRDAKGAISRYADFFPQDVQNEIRSQLANGLRAIICQKLLPDILPGHKRHLALEVLRNTVQIASCTRQNRLESIDNYLLTRREDGMLSFDESIRQLMLDGNITKEVAERHVRDLAILKR